MHRLNQSDYLVLEGVSYAFDRKEVFRDFNLSLAPHETVGLVGPSGCGKSTLLNLIAGLLHPQAGCISLRDAGMFREITGERKFCSYMFQDHTLLPWRSVLNNVLLPTEVDRETGRNLTGPGAERALKLLENFGLAECKDLYPHQLSGGMRQRVAFARTFMVERPLYLLDEPFTGVDFVRQLKLERMLSNFLQPQRKNCIIISHDIEAAVALSHRIVVLGGSPANVIKIFETGLGKHWQDPVDARESKPFAETMAGIVESLRRFLNA